MNGFNFHTDPYYLYDREGRSVPDLGQIEDTRRKVESYISLGSVREASGYEMDFAHNGLRVVANAGTVSNPYPNELPGYLNINYMQVGDVEQKGLTVNLPMSPDLSPVLRDTPIRDCGIVTALGYNAMSLLVEMIDYQAEVAEKGYAEESRNLSDGAHIMLDIVRNGHHALTRYLPYLEDAATAGEYMPRLENLISSLRTSLGKSAVDRKFVTYQSPQIGSMTANGIIVTPSSEREVIIKERAPDHVDDTYEVDLRSTEEIEDEGKTVAVKVVKKLYLPLTAKPRFTLDIIPPLPDFSEGSEGMADFMSGRSPYSKFMTDKEREAVLGDLRYFVGMLALAYPKTEGRG